MDIPSNTNISGKYVLNASQYGKLKEKGMVNPLTSNMSNASYGLEPVYVIKKQDFAVNHHNAIIGEGGLGSGESLEKRFPNASAEELKRRRYAQIKNAQRKYRSKPENRANYNAYMRDLYNTMANEKKFIDGQPSRRFAKTTNESADLPYSDPAGWYKYRLEKAKEANAKYREKKKAQKVISNLDKIIEKELKERFKQEFKNKRGRPSKKEGKKVFDPDSAWYKENFEKLKLEKQSELEKTGTIVPYKIRQKKTQPEYPLGTYKVNKDGINELITAIDDKPVDDRKEYDVDASAYKKKRERPKAPPVVSEKKKKEASPFTPKEPVVKVQKWEEGLNEKQILAMKYIKDVNKKAGVEAIRENIAIKNPDVILSGNPFKSWYNETYKAFKPKENITMTITEK